MAFLRAYFLGDGTIGQGRISFTTVSRELASQLSYLLLSLGAVASVSHHAAGNVSRPVRGKPIVTRHDVWTVTVNNGQGLEALREVWKDHRSADSVERRLEHSGSGAPRIGRPVGEDLLALPMSSIRPWSLAHKP